MLERLSLLRKERKWSLQETADHLGIAKSTYAGYESGYREPSLHSLCQIADLFETTIDYLLGRTDDAVLRGDGCVELGGWPQHPEPPLTIDGNPLTPDELLDFLAFVRTKRELKAQEQQT